MLENWGWKEEKLEKKREKRENWRTKVEMRGQEKREGWEAQRAEGLLRLKWLHCAVWCCRIARSTANTKHLCVTLSYLTQFSRKSHEKQQKTTIWYPLIIKNVSKTMRKRQNLVQNHKKSHKNMEKTTIWCPKLTNRGSYVSEIFEQARIKEFI